MKRSNFLFRMVMMVSIVYFLFSCTTNDVDDPIDVNYSNDYKVSDEAFGEYLYFRAVSGVSRVADGTGLSGFSYYIDTVQAKNQTKELDLNKSGNAIAKLEGVATAEVKIKNVDGLKYFTNTVGLILTSNEVEVIDLTRLTKLENLNLNNNFIGSLDLTKNTNLVTLTYTASGRASDAQKLNTIDLSNNTKLTSVTLSGHPGAPFPIPEEIFNQLKVAAGVKPMEVIEGFKIPDEAFGEYLYFREVLGVSRIVNGTSLSGFNYYIDTIQAKNQTKELDLSKSAAAIEKIKGTVITAAIKIKNVDGLKYFTNTIGLILTSNEIEVIDLSRLSKLENLNLNNNFIGSLDLANNTNLINFTYTASSNSSNNQKLHSIDLSKNIKLESLNLNNNFIGSLYLNNNVELKTLSYTPNSKASASQKLSAIDLSANTKLTSVDLSNHPGAPFPIPASIFNNLTVAKGVISQQ